jgi:NADPH:quinone reductase
MRAIVIREFGGPDVLGFEELPLPEPGAGEVRIRVRAFGVNHAETHMRRGEWAEAARVSGIECAGTVDRDPDGRLAPGQKVFALMGGLGRTRDGSYAEYVVAPASNVVPIESDLPWAELGAIPESYATAWTCLQRNLELGRGQSLLVRGATSALGQAALNVAVQAGARVVATTRNPARAPGLRGLGAEAVALETPDLPSQLRELHPHGVDAVLDLVGNSTILESLGLVRRGGRVCLAGFLGGLAPLPAFNPLAQLPSGAHLSFFGSFMFGAPSFPLSDVPLQAIADRAREGAYRAKPARTFRFDEIREAHRLMDASRANGKLVVLGPE